jgi:hypothetical protein
MASDACGSWMICGPGRLAEMTELSHEHVLALASEWLGLKPRERSVLRQCLGAWSLVPNGNLLISPSSVPSAERLMERGYLTKSENQTAPYDPKGFGMVVVLEQANWSKLIADANATRDPAEMRS